MPQFPDDTITRAELKAALSGRQVNNTDAPGRLDFGYYTPDTLADSMVDGVQYKRKNLNETLSKLSTGRSDMPYFPGEKITLAELEGALVRGGFADYTTPAHVRKIWDDIKIHREGFTQGDIVTSSTGAVFALQPSGRWKNYTDGNFVNYDVPGRPLTKIGRTTS